MRRFTALFATLQTRRHDADYDPHATFKTSEVVAYIAAAETVITALAAAPARERRALFAAILFERRA